MTNPILSSLRYQTDALPGIGGVIKQREADFFVEELPYYEPSGQGEHLMLFVHRKNMTTLAATKLLAKTFGINQRDVGYAGLKDKFATTRQYFTIYLSKKDNDQALIAKLADTPLAVLWAERHGNKIRKGHLRGNRFVIRIRQVDATKVVAAKQILDLLQKQGIANYFGKQRFGQAQNNHLLGRCLLLGDDQAFLDVLLSPMAPEINSGINNEKNSEINSAIQQAKQAYKQADYERALELMPRHMRHERYALNQLCKKRSAQKIVRKIDKIQLEFFVSAWQSYLFNQVVDRRIKQQTLNCLQEGDLACKHINHSYFAVDHETAALENQAGGRIESFEISPSGPLWGKKMSHPQADIAKVEREVLEANGLSETTLAAVKVCRVNGARRPLRVKLDNTQIAAGVDEHGHYVKVSFDLEAGSFATAVLREIMKNDGHEELWRDGEIK